MVGVKSIYDAAAGAAGAAGAIAAVCGPVWGAAFASRSISTQTNTVFIPLCYEVVVCEYASCCNWAQVLTKLFQVATEVCWCPCLHQQWDEQWWGH